VPAPTHISNEVDEGVCEVEGQSFWRGFLKAHLQGPDAIRITEEAHIAQQEQGNLWVLEG